MSDQSPTLEQMEALLEAKKAYNEAALEKLNDLYVGGGFSEIQYNSRTAAIEAELAAIQSERITLQQAGVAIDAPSSTDVEAMKVAIQDLADRVAAADTVEQFLELLTEAAQTVQPN